MPHYVAFLRGINLGNRRIKMGALRALFEELKFAGVATFIASGNVIFSAKMADDTKLAKKIAAHLAASLGYPVDTFVRTHAEVTAVAAFRPFGQAEMENPAHTVHAGFFAEPLAPVQSHGLMACRTDADEFCVAGREYYWLCRIKTHESNVWASPAIKTLKLPSSTLRNLTTIRKLAALYPAPV